MTDVKITAGTLYAAQEDRVVSGLLLPFGELGNTNLGKFTVEPDVITIPGDVSVLAANSVHDREQPLARFMTAVQTGAGIVASFLVGKNPEGDQLLAEIADKTNPKARRKLSAEVKNLVIEGGKAKGGTLFGAAFVPEGAWPSATLYAADVGEGDPAPTEGGDPKTTTEKFSDEFVDEDGVKHKRTTTRTTTIDGDTTTIKETTVIEDPTPDPSQEETQVTDTLLAGKKPTTTGAKPGLSLAALNTLYAARAEGRISDDEFADKLKGENGATLFAALSDVKFDGVGGLAPVMGQPQWIGEIWTALKYTQQVLPLFTHENLTALKGTGFKWTTKPHGGDWDGNKADVPSNVLTVAPAEFTASRYAVGHDIAREFVDFPVAGFFESYAAAVTEDYARWADAKVATSILAGATPLAADALTTLPGGTANIGSAASAVIDGAVALAATGTLPTFALLAPALYKQMLKTPNNNVLGYLTAALGLTEGDLSGFILRPSATIPAGKVLVGAREAVTVRELPGVPIRVDALDLARGGVDKAAFGYAATMVNDARGLQLVTAATV
ncbi:hypothetical protein [Herbiconiux flava]|uniref:Uncharacterized protein n=1 Tax=Herbiconiux flava TaxID=881268 RepID=A0A852STE3_9MICO|nr:hypothetical protein [Herbiconiux flava]NYD72298.1 hypothetical protein [Herbiconiux flava]GLK17739.1 hypothetical protein GCM10017602_22210 [Herbiconiux flava]